MLYFGSIYKQLDFKEGPTKKGGQWYRTNVAIELDGSKGNIIPVDFWGHEALTVKDLRNGTPVKFTVTLKGREWQGKYFLNAEGKSLEVLGSGRDNAAPASQPVQQTSLPTDYDDDLPF
jgi:hypothetical protein